MVAEDRLAGELADRLGAGRCSPFRDPYDALGALHDRPWSAVILSGQAKELPGMVRAVKRLRSDARVFAWCPSEARDALGPLVDDGLEGLFSSPATAQELDRCAAAIDQTRVPEPTVATPPAPEAAPAVASAEGGISTAELIRLFRSAASVVRLESAVGRLVRQQLQCEAYWRDGQTVPDGAAILLSSDGDRPRALLADRLDRALTRRDREFIDSVQSCLSGLLAAARRMESMRHLASTDGLTGLSNRRYFYQRTDTILRRMARAGREATLVLFDVDNFKHYNDTYGHAAGDEILRETAAMMRQTMRQHDIVARIGGDEFAVLLWDAKPARQLDSQPIHSAMEMVGRFHRAISQQELPMLGPEAKGALTMSGGAAVFPRDGDNCRELLRRADQALSQAKRSGKDTINLVGDSRC